MESGFMISGRWSERYPFALLVAVTAMAVHEGRSTKSHLYYGETGEILHVGGK